MHDGRNGARGPVGEHLTLLLLQAVLACLVLWPFLTGERYFAYLDIASDTYTQYVAYSQDLIRLFGREGWTGWSFHIGLGAPLTSYLGDPMRLLSQLGGAEHVLRLRIWVYLLKIALGGAFFLLLARQFVPRREAALVGALCYSFCGYMVINGVWDSETSAFVFFPLVLWALVRHLRTGDLVSFPLAVGAALLAGTFFVSLAVSLFIAFLGCVALARDPRAMAATWLTRLVPLALLGFVIGAPHMLPSTVQLLDSPRVGGAGATLERLLQALQPSDLHLFSLQVAGLFHKDLLGIGNDHLGFMNYLEGPGFYAGLLWLLLLAQLWRGAPGDRRALLVGLAGCTLYMLWPVFRLAAFGFAAPYFRATTLWITLALLLLGVRALDQALDRVDLRQLVVGLVGCLLLLVGGSLTSWGVLWVPHLVKVVIGLLAWTLLLAVARWRGMARERLASLVLLFALVELVVFAWPSYLADRTTAAPRLQPFQDVTLPALQAIRQQDSGVFRVEKTYASASQTDSIAQGFMGVRSYYYHGSGVYAFHRAMGMLPHFGPLPPVNHTNWLEGPRDRVLLHSLLGVKYVISREPLAWPGFELAQQGAGWAAYRNPFALPLGVVQTRQLTLPEVAFEHEPPQRRQQLRELALLNAVVLDAPLPQWGRPLDPASLAGPASDGLAALTQRAQELQRTGLRIESFAHDRIVGKVAPTEAGILVFSIPDYNGWSLRVDGQPTPLLRVDFGLLGAPVAAGTHEIELEYALPGLRQGALLGVLGLALTALLYRRQKGRAAAPA